MFKYDLVNNKINTNISMYFNKLQSVQNPSSSSGDSSASSPSSSSINTKEISNLASGIGPLPIIHEDMELMGSLSVPLGHTPGNFILENFTSRNRLKNKL